MLSPTPLTVWWSVPTASTSSIPWNSHTTCFVLTQCMRSSESAGVRSLSVDFVLWPWSLRISLLHGLKMLNRITNGLKSKGMKRSLKSKKNISKVWEFSNFHRPKQMMLEEISKSWGSFIRMLGVKEKNSWKEKSNKKRNRSESTVRIHPKRKIPMRSKITNKNDW